MSDSLSPKGARRASVILRGRLGELSASDARNAAFKGLRALRRAGCFGVFWVEAPGIGCSRGRIGALKARSARRRESLRGHGGAMEQSPFLVADPFGAPGVG